MSDRLPKRPIFAQVPVPSAPAVNTFVLGQGERFLFDSWATEHTGICGTEVDYFSLNLDRSKRDPLYDESAERRWDGPFKLTGWVEWPNGTPEAREEGFRTKYLGSLWIARKMFEDKGCPLPNESDLVRFWNLPFFRDFGVDGETVPGSGYAFDILNVNDDGHLFCQPYFVGFRCDFGRRTEFTPERRLLNK